MNSLSERWILGNASRYSTFQLFSDQQKFAGILCLCFRENNLIKKSFHGGVVVNSLWENFFVKELSTKRQQKVLSCENLRWHYRFVTLYSSTSKSNFPTIEEKVSFHQSIGSCFQKKTRKRICQKNLIFDVVRIISTEPSWGW